MALSTKQVGLGLGPAVFLGILLGFSPDNLSQQGVAVLAVTLWVAIWWITEAIPISVTALLPIVLLPLFGGVNIADVTASYGHKYIFLYMGGFILAIAIERWNLHRRIALTIIYVVGSTVVVARFEVISVRKLTAAIKIATSKNSGRASSNTRCCPIQLASPDF